MIEKLAGMSEIIDHIIEIDRNLLVFFNNLGSLKLDPFWLILTDKLFYIPFFIYIIYVLNKSFGIKNVIIILLGISLLILITDQFTNFIKDFFERLRPCRDDSINYLLRTIDVRCGKYGFFSAHAANSMAVSTLIYKLIRFEKLKLLKILLISWVIIFSYSRIYLGVHFPLDSIFGLLTGFAFGLIFYNFLIKFINR
jgi:undecaprenyl-diphosphatase